MQLAVLTDDSLTSLDGAPLAGVAGFNPLALEPDEAAARLPASELIVGWSGGLGETIFERAFATWMPAGRAAFTAYLDAAEPVLVAVGRRLLLRTHARHVVSDFVAAKALLAEREGGPFGIALDPAGCFEASMLTDKEDHLVRTFGPAGRAGVIILRSIVQPSGSDDAAGRPLECCALGEGLLEAGLLGELTREHAAADAIVAVCGADPAGQFRRAGLL